MRTGCTARRPTRSRNSDGDPESGGGRRGRHDPQFRPERAQVVLYYLNIMMREGQIQDVDVYVDSPMAAKMTHLYEEGAGELKDHVAAELVAGRDPFEPPTLKYTVATEESKRLNDLDCCAIVLAGAGMMTGGRILHHLKNQLYKPEASLVVVGYQSQGRWGGGSSTEPGRFASTAGRSTFGRACTRSAACPHMPIGTIFSAGWKARARRTPISSMASRRSCRASPDSWTVAGAGQRPWSAARIRPDPLKGASMF